MTSPTNPFGNSLQFLQVAYLDQLNHVAPPSLQVPAFTPAPSTITQVGLTLELWFQAQTNGILVSVPMSNGQATAIAPLIYIDSNGMLRAGLFDSTQFPLAPQMNLIASQNAQSQVTGIGALNALQSPLSVVDGEWHHAALVVQPGAGGTQSLFLDGRLAASGKANGSFGLSFVASDGTTWNAQTPAVTIFGGSITPQPVGAPAPFQPYAQGFCGSLNELRTWYGARSATGIQQLMDEQLFPNLSSYQQNEGLAGYASSPLFDSLPQSTYLVTTPDAPPVDPFTNVDRVPGYQNYGICTAIPFTTVALGFAFQPSQTYSTKISLCRKDQLLISFPSTDANGDDLPQGSTFSMTLTGGITGQIQSTNEIAPGSGFTITAPLTDCYRFDFTYSQTVTIDNLQFMLVPGPANTFMQLILDVLPSQTAYTDPNYPITPTTLPDPRPQFAGKSVTLSPYWPLFTDQTAFPIASSATYNAGDLLSSYLNFNTAAQALAPGTSFTDFFNLGNASKFSHSDLSTLLNETYLQVTKKTAPIIPPQAPFDSADDQIYAFIFNANTMRKTLGDFLKAYNTWTLAIIGTLSVAEVPSTVATTIYDGQGNLQLNSPSKGDFIGSLLVTSAIVGLGAVLGPLMGPLILTAELAATVSAQLTLSAIGGGAANAASELIGSFWSSSSTPKLQNVNYATLEEAMNNVKTDTTSAFDNIIGHLLDPAYIRTLYSNYGLLQALSFVNGQPLFDVNKKSIQPDPNNNSLITGITYASWKALIPACFTWSPAPLTNQQLDGNDVVFQVTQGEPLLLPNGSSPTRLGIQQVLQSDPWKAFYWMLHQLRSWQTGAESRAGQFFSACPIFFSPDVSHWTGPGPAPKNPPVATADWVIAWSLVDTNGNTINSTTATTLFGQGSSTSPLNVVDPNNPIMAVGYGWYCPVKNVAVTTPFDAFMNWGGMPYSPGILVAFPAEGSNTALNGPVHVLFDAAGASDAPPPALVTLEPSFLNFGAVEIGSVGNQVPIPIFTNNSQNDVPNIAAYSDNQAFKLSILPTELLANQTLAVGVAFYPDAGDVGPQFGTFEFITSDGPYGETIVFLLTCSGVGVEPQ